MKRILLLLSCLLDITSVIVCQDITIGLNFPVITQSDSPSVLAATVPDPNGAVGLSQIVTVANSGFRSFDKFTGLPDFILDTNMEAFFGFPVTDLFDPRIRYDSFTDRWYIVAIDRQPLTNSLTNNNLWIAVSSEDPITPLTTWNIYTISSSAQGGDPTLGIDFPGMGIDENNLIVAIKAVDPTVSAEFGPASTRDNYIFVIPTAALISGSIAGQVTIFRGLIDQPFSTTQTGIFAPTAADNYDANPAFGYVIGSKFARSGADEFDANQKLVMFKIDYSGPLSLQGPFDILIPYAPPPLGDVPTKSDFPLLAQLVVDALDNRVYNAHVRNGLLYTANTYLSDLAGTGTETGDRNGVRWYIIDGLGTAQTPTLIEVSSIFDPAITGSPRHYWFPSVMTTATLTPEMALCANGTGFLEYVNGFVVHRTAPNTSSQPPQQITNSSHMAINTRWGDLSYMSPDATNPLAMWSFLEWGYLYADWAVQATQLLFE